MTRNAFDVRCGGTLGGCLGMVLGFLLGAMLGAASGSPILAVFLAFGGMALGLVVGIRLVLGRMARG